MSDAKEDENDLSRGGQEAVGAGMRVLRVRLDIGRRLYHCEVDKGLLRHTLRSAWEAMPGQHAAVTMEPMRLEAGIHGRRRKEM